MSKVGHLTVFLILLAPNIPRLPPHSYFVLFVSNLVAGIGPMHESGDDKSNSSDHKYCVMMNYAAYM